MAGFGVLIVSGILSAIFLFFIAVFAAAAAYIMASYVLEGFSIACMRKKAGDAHTFPAGPVPSGGGPLQGPGRPVYLRVLHRPVHRRGARGDPIKTEEEPYHVR